MPTKKKILVVDDESDLLRVMVIRLEGTGFEVIGGADGKEALELARKILPDLIILDVYLPVMDGDEVAKILKSDEKMKQIPIILISASTRSLPDKVKKSGADDYIIKTFEPEELIEKVKKLIDREK